MRSFLKEALRAIPFQNVLYTWRTLAQLRPWKESELFSVHQRHKHQPVLSRRFVTQFPTVVRTVPYSALTPPQYRQDTRNLQLTTEPFPFPDDSKYHHNSTASCWLHSL